ncbi:hypothetical protein ASG31_14775 [Chryseobacterium sp. Leaf404]|uniref:hypothetical protein n=1 Tax=unclassified Chryseobacterium TaxID=2593645 RepID=UPI0006F1F1E0|nr:MULTISPECIES: hypothetical protein [unclassified Chryseobacterium]KQT15521.1 hypothetical protein ASG31_14775 [Chryseobacterium sp. Leaf404]
MKKSLFKLALFSILPLLVIGYAVFLTGKKTDDFYKRFSSPQQNSLILGSSRAAGMNPAILDSILNTKYPDVKLYNYAFTWAHSPYGPKYLESVKKKIKPETKSGFFIVTVEPTALMVDKNLPDSPENYNENDKSVAMTSTVSGNPNFEYLLENYNFSITHVLNRKILPEKNAIGTSEILDNGKIKVTRLKAVSLEKLNKENKIRMAEFEDRMINLKFSERRLSYLAETIDFLKKHGTVVLVRMPINTAPYLIEKKYYPDFDSKISILSSQKNVLYINYNNLKNDYLYGDEVHLTSESMDKFSQDLGEKLLLNH